ncbi:Sterigmatocystin 8-O-methyltransferase [Cyphellophora attinorum]|uniref:Sterigmatocystin 8-O-methyltransferase n=1 Tax=Cyphellophora attinorum TaxID=1664694 RepID=A0A0N1HXA4_9EURO|nr:Sterigmatocystin 8-O-methyltransferase [Phialophora attinorum]KPI42545.1 Sterigmatocystin 8-O-methyltransferase [Phialophora attinorum]
MAFTALAHKILTAAQTLDTFIETNNLPTPTTGPKPNLPPAQRFNTPQTSTALATLLHSTHLLSHLATGPAHAFLGNATGPLSDALTNSLIVEFDIASHVPLPEDAPEGFPMEKVARACGLLLEDFQLVVRYAMTNFVFTETKPGWIGHTAASRVLRENKVVKSLAVMGAKELWTGSGKEVEVLRRAGAAGGRGTAVESAWALANNASTPLFQHLDTHAPERAKDFAFAMEALASLAPPSLTLNHYPWHTLPPNALIVDVGGGKGFVPRTLASAFPHFRFIVQDLPGTVAAGRAQLPPEFAGRIEFQDHDFFKPQKRLEGRGDDGADVFFLRAIVHDWPDEAVVQILRNLIPGLKKGARVVVVDPHTPAPRYTSEASNDSASGEAKKTSWLQDRLARGSNLRMKVFFNSHDREEGEWEGLFNRADPQGRFRVRVVEVYDREEGNVEGQLLVAVEAIWEG